MWKNLVEGLICTWKTCRQAESGSSRTRKNFLMKILFDHPKRKIAKFCWEIIILLFGEGRGAFSVWWCDASLAHIVHKFRNFSYHLQDNHVLRALMLSWHEWAPANWGKVLRYLMNKVLVYFQSTYVCTSAWSSLLFNDFEFPVLAWVVRSSTSTYFWTNSQQVIKTLIIITCSWFP